MLQWPLMLMAQWMIPERQLKRKGIGGFVALLLLVAAALLAGCFGGGKDAAEVVAPSAAAESTDIPQAVLVPTWTNTPDPSLAQASSPSPTVAPTPLGSSSPAPLPTVSPMPGPTIAADQQLAVGKEYLRLQDYSSARQALSALVAAVDIDQTTRLEALLALARVEFDDPSSAAALTAVDRLLAEQDAVGSADLADGSPKEIIARGHFLRAEILSSIGRYSDAVAEYWLFLETYSQLGEVAQLRIADAYRAMGDLEAASAAYRRAADAILSTSGLQSRDDIVAYVLILESLAQANSSIGRYQDAVSAYDEILAVAESAHYRADIQFRAGQALAAAGDVSGAVERWNAATQEDQTSGSAYSALIELVNRDVAFDLYQRGVIDLHAEAWVPAIAAFESYLETSSATDARFPLALLGAGQAYAGSGAFAEGLSYFERVISAYPACECVGEAWLEKAAAESALGDDVAAHRTYRTFSRENSGHPLAPEALWRSALLALGSGRELEAGLDFLTLADSFPESEQAPASLYAVGIGAYREGLYGQSVDTFGRLQRDYPDYRWDAVGFWLGRAQHANGMPNAGVETWRNLVDRAPDIYHGILAGYGLQDPSMRQGNAFDDISLMVSGSTPSPGDDGSQAYAEQWLAGWVDGINAGSNLSILPSVLLTDTQLVAGQVLLDVGQRTDGTSQLARVYRRYRDDPAILYPLMLEFERLGAHRLSISAATYLLQSSPERLLEETPLFLQRIAYPRHFEELVVREALNNDLDPNLYFSLIRQESLFEEGARSSAAAQGLAQIIPDTGSWIANRLGYPNYTNDLVYRPDVNLKFGAYYLAWARDYLDGSLTSALAGYNAGPGNAERWRKLSGNDDALFVELFDYNEPRVYIHAILSNLYHYSRLYSSP
jgi:soluble lytic murein transglycosylase